MSCTRPVQQVITFKDKFLQCISKIIIKKKIIYYEGNPKGVMISHGNILTSLNALYKRLGTVRTEKDIYVAYLPLAHILELSIEIGCLINGIRLAYSSPQTISDTATAIKKGQKGDLRIMKPTIMAAVPVV